MKVKVKTNKTQNKFQNVERKLLRKAKEIARKKHKASKTLQKLYKLRTMRLIELREELQKRIELQKKRKKAARLHRQTFEQIQYTKSLKRWLKLLKRQTANLKQLRRENQNANRKLSALKRKLRHRVKKSQKFTAYAKQIKQLFDYWQQIYKELEVHREKAAIAKHQLSLKKKKTRVISSVINDVDADIEKVNLLLKSLQTIKTKPNSNSKKVPNQIKLPLRLSKKYQSLFSKSASEITLEPLILEQKRHKYLASKRKVSFQLQEHNIKGQKSTKAEVYKVRDFTNLPRSQTSPEKRRWKGHKNYGLGEEADVFKKRRILQEDYINEFFLQEKRRKDLKIKTKRKKLNAKTKAKRRLLNKHLAVKTRTITRFKPIGDNILQKGEKSNFFAVSKKNTTARNSEEEFKDAMQKFESKYQKSHEKQAKLESHLAQGTRIKGKTISFPKLINKKSDAESEKKKHRKSYRKPLHAQTTNKERLFKKEPLEKQEKKSADPSADGKNDLYSRNNEQAEKNLVNAKFPKIEPVGSQTDILNKDMLDKDASNKKTHTRRTVLRKFSILFTPNTTLQDIIPDNVHIKHGSQTFESDATKVPQLKATKNTNRVKKSRTKRHSSIGKVKLNEGSIKRRYSKSQVYEHNVAIPIVKTHKIQVKDKKSSKWHTMKKKTVISRSNICNFDSYRFQPEKYIEKSSSSLSLSTEMKRKRFGLVQDIMGHKESSQHKHPNDKMRVIKHNSFLHHVNRDVDSISMDIKADDIWQEMRKSHGEMVNKGVDKARIEKNLKKKFLKEVRHTIHNVVQPQAPRNHRISSITSIQYTPSGNESEAFKRARAKVAAKVKLAREKRIAEKTLPAVDSRSDIDSDTPTKQRSLNSTRSKSIASVFCYGTNEETSYSPEQIKNAEVLFKLITSKNTPTSEYDLNIIDSYTRNQNKYNPLLKKIYDTQNDKTREYDQNIMDFHYDALMKRIDTLKRRETLRTGVAHESDSMISIRLSDISSSQQLSLGEWEEPEFRKSHWDAIFAESMLKLEQQRVLDRSIAKQIELEEKRLAEKNKKNKKLNYNLHNLYSNPRRTSRQIKAENLYCKESTKTCNICAGEKEEEYSSICSQCGCQNCGFSNSSVKNFRENLKMNYHNDQRETFPNLCVVCSDCGGLVLKKSDSSITKSLVYSKSEHIAKKKLYSRCSKCGLCRSDSSSGFSKPIPETIRYQCRVLRLPIRK